MNKEEIQKIVLFIDEVNRLPNELLTSEDIAAFTSDSKTEMEKQKVYDKQKRLFTKVEDIQIELFAYFRAIFGESSTYIEQLESITFKPKRFVFNTIHFENNDAWKDDKSKLLSLLKMAKVEFEEKIRIAKYKPENTPFLKTKEAKGIILTAVLATITALFVTKDFWLNKQNSNSTPVNVQISKVDSLVSADKKNVVNKIGDEVFTNYYQTIIALRKNYAAVSAEGYISDYLKNERENIESRILSKSYIHRFAVNEKLWTDADFNEVAILAKARTVTRIKEITEDVDSKAQGPFILTDDRLGLLEEQVKKEVEQNNVR